MLAEPPAPAPVAPPRARRRGQPAAVPALLLAMAAVALVTVRLAATVSWAEPAGGIAFVALAAILLRYTGGER